MPDITKDMISKRKIRNKINTNFYVKGDSNKSVKFSEPTKVARDIKTGFAKIKHGAKYPMRKVTKQMGDYGDISKWADLSVGGKASTTAWSTSSDKYRHITGATKLSNTKRSISKSIQNRGFDTSYSGSPPLQRSTSKIAKVASVASKVSKYARSPMTGLARSAGIAGTIWGAGMDVAQLSRMGMEIGRSVRHKGVKAIPREQSIFSKPRLIKYETTPKQKMYNNIKDVPAVLAKMKQQKAASKVSKFRDSNLQHRGSSARTSRGGATPKALQEQRPSPPPLPSLSFLKITPRVAVKRPIPKRPISTP